MTLTAPRIGEAIDYGLCRLDQLGRRQRALLACISQLSELSMTTEQDIKDEIDRLRQAILDDTANDQAAVEALEAAIADGQAQIQTLKDQLEQLGQTPAVDLDGIFASIQSAKSLIVPVTVTPAAADPQIPVGETPVDVAPSASS